MDQKLVGLNLYLVQVMKIETFNWTLFSPSFPQLIFRMNREVRPNDFKFNQKFIYFFY